MKITYVVPFKVLIPSKAAHTVNIMNMCSAMSELGHDVTLIIPDSRIPDAEIFSYYGLPASFRIERVNAFSSKWAYPYYSFLVSRKIKSINPDIVTGRSALTCLFAAIGGFDVAYDSHAPAWLLGKFQFLAYLLLKNSSRLVRMTVNSEALKEMYIRSGYAPHCPLIAAHNGSRVFSLEDKFSGWQKREGALQVGYAGHLYKGRGIELIISCAKEVPDADFHIVGGTEDDIRYWKDQTKLPNLIFHGFVSPGEVYKFRNMMDVLLAPYPGTGVTTGGGKEDSSKYMNPIKIIEYMSSRKAIIASDLPPIREVLKGSMALLVNSESSEAWINAIRKLKDPELRKKLADNSFDFFQKNLTWKARAAKLIPVK